MPSRNSPPAANDQPTIPTFQDSSLEIDNPYAAPTARIDDKINATRDIERIRQDHIRHEVQLKSIGSLYGFAAILLGMSAVFIFITLFVGDNAAPKEYGSMFTGMLLVYGALSVAMFAMAYGYRKLLPWVKIPGTLLSVIGLLGIPVGTLINGYILYLIWCKQGQVVLGDGYQDIIRATPHVKYKRTLGDKIALGIVIALLLGGVLLLLASAFK